MSERTMNLEEFAFVIGVSRTHAYALAKEDKLPVPVIRIGRRIVVSRAAVEELIAGRRSSPEHVGEPA